MPEESGDSANHNCEAREVPAKGGAHRHRERDMESSTDYAVKNKRDSADERTEDDAVDCFSP